jgi:hypothetical protein
MAVGVIFVSLTYCGAPHWVPHINLRHLKYSVLMHISGAECSACNTIVLCWQFSDTGRHCALLHFAWCYGK